MLQTLVSRRGVRALALAGVMSMAFVGISFAQDGGPSTSELAYAVDNLILFITAILVLFMQAGFALVEGGFNESKNNVNIMMKNVIDLLLGILLYFLVGYGLMYGSDVTGGAGFLAFGGFGIGGTTADVVAGSLNPQVDFLFQVAFAATAATIVSGAVAGRIQFRSYLVYTIFLTGLVYPISGYWKWGGGWLDAMGFADFAGSILVHAVGGFAGLAGAILLGPRLGRFNEDGTPNAMPASNLVMATLGVFILFVGWFGFNPGSQLAFVGAANTDATMLIATNTTLAAATGGIAAMLLGWFLSGKPTLSYTLNGILGGLVGITANCNDVTNVESLIIGAIAGLLVIGGMLLLEKLKIDDPVGAFPVHGVGGLWGGIATGIFGASASLGVQVLGSIVIPLWSFATMFALFSLLKAIGWLRVTAEEEAEGLDIGEHGETAYVI